MLRYYVGPKLCPMTAAVLDAAGGQRTRDVLSDWDLYIPQYGADFSAELSDLLPSRTDQWIAGMPGIWRLTNKTHLWSGVVTSYGRQEAARLLPMSWLSSRAADRERLRAQHRPGQVYILKNPILQRRKGLRLARELEAIHAAREEGFTLVQRMLPELMLVSGHRFNLRLYLLLVQRAGRVSAWLHRMGRCLCAPSRFTGALMSADEVITRSVGSDALAPGLPFTLGDLLAELSAPRDVLRRLDALLSRVLAAAVPGIQQEWSLANNPAYQLLGVDVVITAAGELRLIEMNTGPELRPSCARDRGVKERVVRDSFALLGLLPRAEPPDFRGLEGLR